MNLKQLRLSRQLSQEQLAQMSGLNVRTIQRIESGANASLESQKCLGAALNVDLDTLTKERVMLDKHNDHYKQLPLFLKIWFAFHFLKLRPSRNSALRVECICHVFGYVFCILGLFSEAAIAGAVIMLSSGYLFTLLKHQGDTYQIWYDAIDD